MMLATLVAASALAGGSAGALLSRTLGETTDKTYRECAIFADRVVLKSKVGDDTFTSTRAITLDQAQVAHSIALAADAETVMGYHIREQIPHERFAAFETIGDEVTLRFDGSAIIDRQGDAAAELVGIINYHCGSWGY